MFINGEWVESSSNKKIETLNPENNEVWATVPEANEKDVDNAVKSAQKAFENSWSTLNSFLFKFHLNTFDISIT